MESLYQYHTLRNGMRVVFRYFDSEVLQAGVFVNVGSRDEQHTREHGLAHFIEHSVFKGTEHRRAYHILNRIDGVGGELNAFTTKEETCVYATALNEHLERCLELFADILFHSTFPQRELDKEQEVVIEEMEAYKDYPSEQIADDYEELAFDGHPLAHNILGDKRQVHSFKSNDLQEFCHRHYVPENMVVSIVGRVDFRRVIYWCEKYFGGYVPGNSKIQRQAPTPCVFHKTVHRHSHQMHVMVGCPAYDAYDDKRVPFTLLHNILGGTAMNSRLNMCIREQYGFCYTVESQYSVFRDTGLFTIYAGIDASAQERYLELLRKELRRLCTTELTPGQLRAAQRQWICQMTIANSNTLNEMQGMGKSVLVYGRVDTPEEVQREVMNITAPQLREIANELFTPERFSILCYT